MPRRNNRLPLQVEVERRLAHEAYVIALVEGRRERSVTFRPGRGKGSYTRRTKHRPDYLNA